MVDTLSKQTHFTPCPELPTAKELAQLFSHHIIHLNSFPEKIISDHGRQFTASFWKELQEITQIEQRLSSPYHPQK